MISVRQEKVIEDQKLNEAYNKYFHSYNLLFDELERKNVDVKLFQDFLKVSQELSNAERICLSEKKNE